ncbi:translocation/assembly module TamB domain-containing protein [Rhizosaccharibacter radicis]|uniref:Translocation/assembly module TamB domain-containing protein n=1 Tax=Rhizosaccharibacter radicis TaxID=2782605 RepID=A0ABT1VVT2_9PROT|nr:translocation/assembly module TamB domain-containing protein [Acetobacteraceae bacterium KSS12]
MSDTSPQGPAAPFPATPPRRPLWRRIVRALILLLLGLLVILLLALGAVLVGANTGPGRRLIERQTASLTGGTVRIEGLSGRFPDALRLRHVEVRDREGAWLSVDDILLDWSPLRLLGLRAVVQQASIGRLAIPRLPVADPNAPPAPAAQPGAKSGLHLGVDLRQLRVGRLEIGAPVAGTAAVLSIDGHARLADLAPLLSGFSVPDLPDADIALGVRRLDGPPTALDLLASLTPGRIGLTLRADDPAHGLVAGLVHQDGLDPLHAELALNGPRDAAALRLSLTAGMPAAPGGAAGAVGPAPSPPGAGTPAPATAAPGANGSMAAAPAPGNAETDPDVDALLNQPAPRRLTLTADGTLDLVHLAFDLVLHGGAPAMQPVPGVDWNRLALDAHLRGTAAAPAGRGLLVLDNLSAAGAGLNRLAVRFDGAGQSGPLHLRAMADGVRIPGPSPALLAGAPLRLDLSLDPHAAGRPFTLSATHPLLMLDGHGVLSGSRPGDPMRVQITLQLPDLRPLAAIGHTPLDGAATLSLAAVRGQTETDLDLDGSVSITGGQPQAVGLVGRGGRVALAATLDGSDIVLHRLAVDGDALHLTASGTDVRNALDARFSLGLPDLARALPSLRGALSLSGTAAGPLSPSPDLSLHLAVTGDPGTATMPRGPLRFRVDAAHLPARPEGTVALDGTLDRAPLALHAEASRLADGALRVLLDRLNWKSATGRADLTLPAGATLPLGTVDIRMSRLADLSALAGQPVSGSLQAAIQTTQPAGAGAPHVRIEVSGQGGLPTASVRALRLSGTVDDPVKAPRVDLRLDATGIRSGAIAGDAHVTARGPRDALMVSAQAALPNLMGAPARLDTALRLDLPARTVALSRLDASAKGEALRLLAPARLSWGDRVAVDRLRVSLTAQQGGAPAILDVAGQVMPQLRLDARLDNVTPALARPFAPTLDAAGVLAMQAHLSGTVAKPDGTVHLAGDGLRLRSGPAASLPAATVRADVALAAGIARLQAHVAAGPKLNLALDGTVPVPPSGPIALRANGSLDLSLANAVLGAQGRQLDGDLLLALQAGGTVQAPRLDGTVQLRNGQFQDYAQGVRLTKMEALIAAQGQSLTIEHLSARAGEGTIDVAGTVGALLPGLPVDLRITASKARPLSSDLLTAVLDADIRAHGQASARLDVGGRIGIENALINIPNSLPPSVAQLHVIRPGEKPPAPAQAGSGGSLIGLDLTVDAPGQILLRGHGLDAELGGRLHVGGTSAAPQISGGFDMRRGTFNLAGVNLTFTHGRVGFNGTGVTHKIDPTLDFTAESQVNQTLARLNVGGYADAPKITLSSVPSLPQDQVLALLLFGEDTKSLSPVQIAEVATALASLTGGGGGGFDPLNTVRKTLGLDRLTVGGNTGGNGNGSAVEAGKYVARGVYVGARQATSGGGSQAQVQIDLTRRLKLLSTVGTGGQVTGITTPENDPGSSVALKYQFQY